MLKLVFESVSLLCLIVGGGGSGGGEGVKLQILGKNPQINLNIIREWSKNNLPPHLRNLYNFPPGAFYSIPPTIRYKRVKLALILLIIMRAVQNNSEDFWKIFNRM